MAANQFDVFVVGSTDPTAAGETRLATALSTKYGIPLATITKAIASKNLRAGQGLEQAVAQTLVRQLQNMGAITVIRPSALASKSQGTLPPPKTPPATSAPAPSYSPVPNNFSPPPSSSGISDQAAATFGPPLMPNNLSTQPGNVFTPARKSTAIQTGTNPFEPPRSITPVLEITRESPIGTPNPPNQTVPSKGDFLTNNVPGPRLELARGDRATSADELSGMRRLPTSASGTNLRDLGLAGKSGVETDRDPRNINLVRCVQHGLYYDKTKASGCRKCLSAAREMAGHLQPHPSGEPLGSELTKHPTKWAFLGLTFALFIGLLPAAYYALGPGTTQAKHHRVEQEILSRQPGSEAILHRFDELEKQISDSRSRTLRNTGIVWLAVSGIAMAGWFKLK